MNAHATRFLIILFLSRACPIISQTALPMPDHIVIAVLENHSYSQIIGSPAAPFINSLADDTLSALFTDSHGITHPSQPNYLILYSGTTQGVINDEVPSGNPFTTANLGRQLIDAGRTFITYSEDLTEAGYNGATSGYYARKHNPLANWMGTGPNQVSSNTNQPLTVFPSDDFTLLPTVCFAVPNLNNDMHNGSDPARITTCDEWISSNLGGYIQWAKANNSLFILTFDEDDHSSGNHILTVFTGQMVQAGQYSTRIDHYSILNTIENIYGLPYLGDSLTHTIITDCWKASSITTVPDDKISNDIIYPNPNNGLLYIECSDYRDAVAEIYNSNGQLIQITPVRPSKTAINTDDLMNGVYLVRIKNREGITLGKFIKN
jgi:phosphatidylinositol-3-phosphatase